MKKVHLLISSFVLCLVIVAIVAMPQTHEETLSVHDVSESDIVIRGWGDSCIELMTIDSVNQNLDAIVYGKVNNVNYVTGSNGQISSIIEFEVMKTLAGEELSGSLSIVKNGGVSSIQDFVESYEDEITRDAIRSNFDAISDEDLSRKYISQFDRRDISIKPDMCFVLLLQKMNEDADYRIVFDYIGEYLEVGNDEFYSPSSGLPYDVFLSGEYMKYFEDDEQAREAILWSQEKILKKYHV